MSTSLFARGAGALLKQIEGAARRELGAVYSCTSRREFSADAPSQESGPAPGEIGEVSGIPEEQLHRKVLIYSPARTASQQGLSKVGRWKIGFDSTSKWENPLMGWTSTGDPYANVGDAGLVFESREAAIAFATKHGWQYSVKEPHRAVKKVKTYADNFKWKGPVPASESAS
eukprot:TRINITY_DN17913_c0_g1_i1.p1 TRINITY_DN17913_c0_g1~~TRINITY_DN17913_c0_g1_i1.p1  ORF type:complete len:172 (+),score=16.35 TRINITY_DN17913_c0_g1_i1:197-712(+)